MDFQERLKQAAQRGASVRADRFVEAAAQALTDEECRRKHSSMRLALCDVIEARLHLLADSFPGFRTETVVDDRGWGALVTRDDVGFQGGKRTNQFSRLQVTVSPYSEYRVFDVVAKGTIRNKDAFTRGHFDKLDVADLERFRGLVEQWVVEYAERFAAS